jgi:tetratricopeptide (TPR) repeat protein
LIVTLLSGEALKSNKLDEVDPSILSLFCRELNDRRLARGDTVIEASLVSGQRDDILESFYDRCFDGIPDDVRDLIERDLITDEGIRVELSLDNAVRAAGGNRAAFETLAARRLLRLEERQGTQRIELIHDVLAEPVRRSRERRGRQRGVEFAAAEQQELDRRRFAHLKYVFVVTVVALLLVGLASGIFLSRHRAALQARAMSCTVSLMPDQSTASVVDADGPRGRTALKLVAGDVTPEVCGRELASLLKGSGMGRPDVIRWAIGLSTLPNEEKVQLKVERIQAALDLYGREQNPRLNDSLSSEAKVAEADLWKAAGDPTAAAAATSDAVALYRSGGFARERSGQLRLADLLMREGDLRTELGQLELARVKVNEALALRQRMILTPAAGGIRLSKVDRFKIAQGYASLGRIALLQMAAAHPGAFASVSNKSAVNDPLTSTGYALYDRCLSRKDGGGGQGLSKESGEWQAIAIFCLSHRFKTLYGSNRVLAKGSVSRLLGTTKFDLNALDDTERQNYYDLLRFMAGVYHDEFVNNSNNTSARNAAGTYNRWVVKAQRDVFSHDLSVTSRKVLVSSLNDLSHYYQLTKNNDQASNESYIACLLDSENPDTYSVWGTAYLLNNRRDDARRMYARAARLSSPAKTRAMLLRQATDLYKVGAAPEGVIENAVRDLDGLALDASLAGQCDDGLKGMQRKPAQNDTTSGG